ncbi:MAG TPA: sugar phosphate isomerase/epimerase [Bryobacteraceae bacterium]|nr:sugar phosphate isomerase/epimerase [Bryobacteraceae bacterium]
MSVFTRRDFGKLAMAGLPLGAALAKINSKVGGVQIGVQSYSYRDRPLDAAIKAMVEDGIGECELFSPHIEPGGLPRPQVAGGGRGGSPQAREELRKWRLTVPMEEIKPVRKKFDDAGISLFAFNYSFRDDFTDPEIERGFQMAQALGVRVITASSTVSVMPRVVPFAEKYKITVGVHGHNNVKDPNEFATPESFAKAMALSKQIGVNLDIGHFTSANFDAVAYIKEHHDRITNLHLKDRKKNDGPNVPFGEGDTPIKQVLQLLKQKGYNFPANIEYEYKGGDSAEEVKKCFDYCKQALA